MNILKAGLFSAVATAARLLSGLFVLKLVAYYAGPEGVAKLGQFMSFMSLLVVIAGGGLGTGLVKYVSEYKEDPAELRNLLGAGLFYTLSASVLTGVLALIFSESLSMLLLGSLEHQSLIWILAIAQCLIALNNFVVAVINGFLDIRRVAMIHLAGALFSVTLTAILAYFFELYGALLALVLGQAGLLLVSVPFLKRSAYFQKHSIRPRFHREKTVLLARFSLMTLVSAALPPLVHIWVRDHLATVFSWTEVGYWQAISKVSDAYLLFITMAINVYYLPKLSAIKERTKFKAELKAAYVYVMPIVTFLALGIYLAREKITLVLFTSEFLAASNLYAPQLAGDVIKIASYILSYIMLAKAMTATFLALEIVFSATYIGWIWLFTDKFGLVGAMYAFIVNYLIYLVCTALVARAYITKMDSS